MTKRSEELQRWVDESPGSNPAVAQAIALLTGHRLEGKEGAKRRPSTLILMTVEGGWEVQIRPEVKKTAAGWSNDGTAEFKAFPPTSDIRRGVVFKIDGEGNYRPTRWWLEVDRNTPEVAAIRAAMDRIEADPEALVTRRYGACGFCGKGLIDDVSVARGVGPECYSRLKQWRARLAKAKEQSLGGAA